MSSEIKTHYPIVARVPARQFADLKRGQAIVAEVDLGEVVIENARGRGRAWGRIEAAETRKRDGKLEILLQVRAANGAADIRRRTKP